MIDNHSISIKTNPPYDDSVDKVRIKDMEEKWLIDRLAKLPHTYQMIKRIMDIVLSFIGLFILFPLLLLVSVIIKFDSKGPIVYTQIRVGERKKLFKVYKFRTMIDNAENGQAVWAAQDDSRITRAGFYLRKMRIDEFPQLFNVLRGEMSLVGPRPERPEFVQILEKEIPFYSYRHVVKPGITGWAQIKYRYANCIHSSLEKFSYDLYGIIYSSLLFDLNILLGTVFVVLTGRGAY